MCRQNTLGKFKPNSMRDVAVTELCAVHVRIGDRRIGLLMPIKRPRKSSHLCIPRFTSTLFSFPAPGKAKDAATSVLRIRRPAPANFRKGVFTWEGSSRGMAASCHYAAAAVEWEERQRRHQAELAEIQRRSKTRMEGRERRYDRG